MSCTCPLLRTVEVHPCAQCGPGNGYAYSSEPAPYDNNTCHIDKIYLIGYGLEGRLPASLFTAFPYIQRIHLAVNKLTGHVVLGADVSLPYLDVLDLGANELSGEMRLKHF